ncbi:MAG: DUF86 domain-containing protein [Pseudomonadota bacterium]|nr:DUF86 domain-containing protein [Pseudomonadota bacterium]MDP1903372.1 DUF86 domain-containing protein [Pseudomonadota bacterium]MDP2352342.1 DUF86 domain-containing protein [Pseudomonadota bacterium]
MNENRLPDYLDHMIAAARQVYRYLESMGKEDFLDQHSDVPWRSMKGMRNRIAHGYFDIDLEVVRETTQTALLRLLPSLPVIRTAAESVPGT